MYEAVPSALGDTTSLSALTGKHLDMSLRKAHPRRPRGRTFLPTQDEAHTHPLPRPDPHLRKPMHARSAMWTRLQYDMSPRRLPAMYSPTRPPMPLRQHNTRDTLSSLANLWKPRRAVPLRPPLSRLTRMRETSVQSPLLSACCSRCWWEGQGQEEGCTADGDR